MKIWIWCSLFFIVFLGSLEEVKSQCPDVLGSFGTIITPSQNPQWIGCGNGVFTVRFQMTGNITGPYTIDWGDGNVSNGTDLLSTNFVAHIYAAAVDTFTVTFTNACGSITGLVVMEEAVIASVKTGFGGVTKACAPATLFFTNQSVHNSPTTTYTWDWGDGSPLEMYGPGNYGDTISHNFLKGTVDCETEVTLTADNFCTAGNPSENILRPIQIWDIDSAVIDASETLLCYPDTIVTFSNVSDLNCATPALGNTVQRFERWTFFDLNGPGQDSVIGWGPFPISTPRTIAFPGPGTYTIELLDSNQCGIATQVMQVVITSPPLANFTNVDSACEGSAVAFQNLSSNGANNYIWDFGDGNTSGAFSPNHTYQTSGNQVVTLIATIAGGSASCRSTAVRNIEILKAPDAGIILSGNKGCDSLNVIFSDSSSSDVVSWNWNFGNGQNSANQNPGLVSFPNSGQFIINLNVATREGCIDVQTDTVNVFLSPIVDISPNSVCEGLLTQFYDQSIISLNDVITNWNWDFGDGTTSTVQNPTHTYLSSDTFDISLSVSTLHCSNSEIVQVIVEPLPIANFLLDTIQGCSPLLISALNQSDSVNTPSLTYEWFLNGQSFSTNLNESFLLSNSTFNDSLYVVSLIAETTFGCRDTVDQNINVFPEVSAAFSNSTVNLCNADSVNFTSSTSANVSNYQWDFGDGSISNQANPSHLFQNDSLTILAFTVTLNVSSFKGCTDSFTDTLIIGPKSSFDFALSPSSGCSPLRVDYSAELGAVSYNWNFGNGQIGFGQNAQMLYTSSVDTILTVQLRTLTGFGCRDTIFKTINIQGGANADFYPSVTNSVCAPAIISFSDSSTNAQNYLWDFGDGNVSTIMNPSHTFFNDSAFSMPYPVRLIVTSPSGCRDTIVKPVVIKPELKLDMNFSPDNFCGPGLVTFNSIGTTASNTWDFGDGNIGFGTSQNHAYIANADSAYFISLIGVSSFNCRDTIFDTLRTRRLPNAQIGPNLIPAQCSPAEFLFENLSIYGDLHTWDFGDGSNPIVNNDSSISYTYLNNGIQNQFYSVNLVASASNGCVDSTLRNIEVYLEVDVVINNSEDSICSGETLTFSVNSNLSSADIYSWDFGNGTFSNGFSGSTTYISNTDSLFQIVLQGQSLQGCQDADTISVLVIRQAFANFNALYNNPACTPLLVNFQNLSDSTFDFIWNFDNGVINDQQFTGLSQVYINTDTLPIIFNPMLILSPGGMCADTAMQNVTVNPALNYDILANPVEGCSPLSVHFSGEAGALIYQWNFGNGLAGAGQNINQIFSSTQDTTFNVRLVTTSPYQCKDTSFQSIVLHPSATADFSTVSVPVCSPAEINFYNLSDTTLSSLFKWDFGDGTILLSDDSVVKHSYSNTGNNILSIDVQLIAYTGFSCNDTLVKSISILPQPGISI